MDTQIDNSSTDVLHTAERCIALLSGDLCNSLKVLWLRLRKLGCIVDAVQAKPSRRKMKCFVENCIYRNGPVESVGLRCTLPSSVETAAQWICMSTADIKRQNNILIKFFNVIREGQPASQSLSSVIQIIPREKLLLLPFRICSRHFSTEPEDLSVPIMPIYNMPGKCSYIREDILPQLRRRYIFLSEIGYEDIGIDKLEPNGVLVSSFDDDICCDIPGCCYKSSDISIFSGRYMKMFSIPSNNVDCGRWCVATRDGLGLPKSFEFCLPENGYICEMHFMEGKRHARGVMQDPSVFRKLAVAELNTSLASLGALCFTTCAVISCLNNKMKAICVPFPKANDPLKPRWISVLSEADESFEYRSGMAVCIRHFSLAHDDGLVPYLFLRGDITSEAYEQLSSKRRMQVNAPQAVKKIRFEKSKGGTGFTKSVTTVEQDSISDETEENLCCIENRNILSIVERMEVQSCAVERLVQYLNSLCKEGLLPIDGSLEKSVKFQLFDILSELRSQRGIVHTLRQRLDEALRDVLDPCIYQ